MQHFSRLLFLLSLTISYGESFNRGYKAQNQRPSPCTPDQGQQCPVSVSSQDESDFCKFKRTNDVEKSRKFFHLTTLGGTKRIRFPLHFVPFLNQTMEKVTLHAALDQTDSKWFSQFFVYTEFLKRMNHKLKEMFAKASFKTPSDYLNIYSVHKMLIQHLGAGQAFTNPTFSPTFTEVIYNRRYFSDDIFVQKRLAGSCPFLIKLVTRARYVGTQWTRLMKLLNPNFDFNTPLQRAIDEEGMTLSKAVEERMLYVLYHEEMRGIPTMPDYFGKPLLNVTSPIAIFARTRSGELKIVAIQIADEPTSSVITPYPDPMDWLEAKNLVNMVDNDVCQAIWHLSHIHLSGTTYCTIFRSHFSTSHPIHQIFRHHCEGTTPHIALAFQTLFAPKKTGQTIFSIGNEGYAKLTVKGYRKFTYGTLDFENVLRNHGLDSYRLKYHPFRDDGRIIWSTFQSFSKQFTNIYYKSDWDVLDDKELQSFASQISIDGQGDSYGGKANIVGFPQSFETKDQVQTFLTRFLWQIAMHAVVNYPLEPYGSFTPLAPSKLYKRGEQDNIYEALSDSGTAIGTTVFSTMLGNMRINRIFDYHDKLKDQNLGALVRKFHHRMHSCVQDTLEKRNARRKANNLLGFQYLEPKWLTNSIHI